jgi:hypothetical protein
MSRDGSGGVKHLPRVVSFMPELQHPNTLFEQDLGRLEY